MQLRRRSNGAPVLLGSVLGKGGEGSVFPVRGAPDLVAKIYAKPEDEKRVVRGFLMPNVRSRRMRQGASCMSSSRRR